MSENESKEAAPAEAAAVAAAPAKKSGPNPIALIFPAILAGAAAFGGAKLSAAHASAAPKEEVAVHRKEEKPPGPTVALEPFLVMTYDAAKKQHPMKMTLAVEFDEKVKEEALKGSTPRIRDATLTYLRTLAYEDVIDASKTEKMRKDLLDQLEKVGVYDAERVLVTDLVVQ